MYSNVMWGIVCAIPVLLCLIAYFIIMDKRRDKQFQKAEAERLREEQAKQAEKPKAGREEFFTTYVGLSREAIEHLELMQLRTNAESPEEVLADALRFYEEIVNLYRPGAQLLFRESADTEDVIIIRFRPLERMGEKAES